MPDMAGIPPQLLEMIMQLRSLNNPPSVGQAMKKELTPMQKERIKGEMEGQKDPQQIIGGQQEMLPPEIMDDGKSTAEELAERPFPKGATDTGGGGMSVGEAMGLVGAGAKATGGMMPRAPSAPALPGGGRFQNIDPTTLMFLQAALRGRR